MDPHRGFSPKVIFGSVLFGLGWGIGGLCPGPFILTIPNSLKIAFYWGLPFFFGQKLGQIAIGNTHKHGHYERVEKAKHH